MKLPAPLVLGKRPVLKDDVVVQTKKEDVAAVEKELSR